MRVVARATARACSAGLGTPDGPDAIDRAVSTYAFNAQVGPSTDRDTSLARSVPPEGDVALSLETAQQHGQDPDSRPKSPGSGAPRFRAATAVVVAYAVAMAFLESAVVVYLQRALGIDPRALFPLRDPAVTGDLALIEVGREGATLVMLGAVGWLAGRRGLERLAWTAVAFGIWDLFYYLWLWAFIGWPSSLGTWDLLFLIPVPWTGPVWAPVAISLALVGFGLAAAARIRAGRPVRAGRAQVVAGVMGGLVVTLSFTWNAPLVLDGGVPTAFPWPVFAAGLAFAAWGATTALQRVPPRPGGRTGR